MSAWRLDFPDTLQDAELDVAQVHVVHAHAVDVIQVANLKRCLNVVECFSKAA